MRTTKRTLKIIILLAWENGQHFTKPPLVSPHTNHIFSFNFVELFSCFVPFVFAMFYRVVLFVLRYLWVLQVLTPTQIFPWQKEHNFTENDVIYKTSSKFQRLWRPLDLLGWNAIRFLSEWKICQSQEFWCILLACKTSQLLTSFRLATSWPLISS